MLIKWSTTRSIYIFSFTLFGVFFLLYLYSTLKQDVNSKFKYSEKPSDLHSKFMYSEKPSDLLNIFDSARFNLVRNRDIQAPNTCPKVDLKVIYELYS